MTCLQIKRKKMAMALYDHINMFAVPSLQDLVIAKMVLGIWKSPDLRDMIERHITENSDLSLFYSQELYVKTKEKLTSIGLPVVLEKRAGHILLTIGHEILNWVAANDDIHDLHEFLLKHLTLQKRIELIDSFEIHMPTGRIDDVKVLKHILMNTRRFSDEFLEDAFNASCIYCDKELLSMLWGHTPKKMRNEFKDVPCYQFPKKKFDEFINNKGYLVQYWSLLLSGEVRKFANVMDQIFNSKLRSRSIHGPHKPRHGYDPKGTLYENIVVLLQHSYNVHALQYIWSVNEASCPNSTKRFDTVSKMLEDQTLLHIHQFLKKSQNYDIVIFLLSQVKDLETQVNTKAFRNDSVKILTEMFRNWNLNKFIIPTLILVQESIEKYKYDLFITNILRDIIDLKNEFAISLFKDIWLETAPMLKEYVIKNSGGYFLLLLLFSENTDTFSLILSDRDINQMDNIVFRLMNYDILPYIRYDKLNFLESFIDQVLDLDVAKYKASAAQQQFAEVLTMNRLHGDNISQEEVWSMAMRLLDWCFDSLEELAEFKRGLNIQREDIADNLYDSEKFELQEKFILWLKIK